MSASITNSILVPVYKNEENIPDLVRRLERLSERIDELEVVFVVDGSPDRSAELIATALPNPRFASQLIEHSRNFGSFVAIRTGMAAANGEFIAVMTADLQEPEELVISFFAELATGDSDIVLGKRTGRRDGPLSRVASALFWRVYRRFVIREIPKGGVDVFACNRKVTDAILSIEEENASLIAQLFWVGFRRSFVPFERLERTKGKSAWSTSRRFRYMADSVIGYSELPILLLVWLGIAGLAFSVGLGLITLVAQLLGLIGAPGFATTILAILFLFSVLITSQGIIGMYIWRTFENVKGRPGSILMSSRSWSASHQEADDESGPNTGLEMEPRRVDTSQLGRSPGSRIPVGVGGCEVWRLPQFADARGSLLPLEIDHGLPIKARRFFCVFGVPDGHVRGEHAHRECEQFLIALHGALSVVVDDGERSAELRLDRPDIGLLVPSATWTEQHNFTMDAVLAVFASDPYDAADYIRSYDEFSEFIRNRPQQT